MYSHILITSFAVWKPHHISNSSDDLIHLLDEKGHGPFPSLRLLPVDFELAPQRVLEKFNELRPKVLICCGMAEERSKLSIELMAVLGEKIMQTNVDLDTLTADLSMTEISHDAGGFVCNTLYFRMLDHLYSQDETHYCLFIHVPLLTEENREQLTADFSAIIQRLSAMSL
jgi:pyroglutamyl-peptidase